jgi:hypothetical protein
MARIEAEEALHEHQRRGAVKVVAATALDADDCRLMLSILGLDDDTVRAARAELSPVATPAAATVKRPRKRHAA